MSQLLRLGLLVLVLLSTSTLLSSSYAEEKGTSTSDSVAHRLVIQVNKKDSEFQSQVLSNIVNLQKHYGLDEIEIEVVAYGAGINLLMEQSEFKARIESLMLQNVVFTACGNTLDTLEAKEDKRPALIAGVEVTQTGIARIMERQEQGWSYLSP